MNDVALVAKQIRYEQKSYWRNPGAAFFTFAFPLVFFFILTSLAGGQTDKQDLGPGVKLSQYYTPSILAYAIMGACLLAVSLTMVRNREQGILKRYRGTPAPAWSLVGGVIGSSVIVTALLTAVVLLFGKVVYGVKLPASHLLPMLVTILIASLVFCAIGIAVSALIPNEDSGSAIINLPFFILVFISGTYFPVNGTLGKVAAFFPLRPFITGMFREFNPYATGSVWPWHDLRTLAIWGVVAVIVAVRRFRWMPSTP
jgi:ABC-2 type transport system permease protein